MKNQCKNCRYFKAIEETDKGECRVDSPQLAGDELNPARSLWPEVWNNEWCGRHWHVPIQPEVPQHACSCMDPNERG